MHLIPLGWTIAALALAPLETALLGIDQPRALLASLVAALVFGSTHMARTAAAERDACLARQPAR